MKKLIGSTLLFFALSAGAQAGWQCGAINGYGAWSNSLIFPAKWQAKKAALQVCNSYVPFGHPLCFINYCRVAW